MKTTLISSATVASLLLAAMAGSSIAPAATRAPEYFAVRAGSLADAKARLAGGDVLLQPALQELVTSADKALKTEPPSVMQKTKNPPSGNRHDYMSVAPYFWPDPAQPGGLPYVRRDGQINPESRDGAYDFLRVERLGQNVETLALAYYFTGKEDYAIHAANYLRTWFIDPATRMNPDMEFAQAVPGVSSGRDIGILEGQYLSKAVDAAGLLAGSDAWTATDRKQLNAWLETYLDWLLTSKNGRKEAEGKNNHGTWYDVQAAEIALVLGKTDLARKICETAREKRLAKQIAPDGSQPRELTRTATFTYCCYNIEAMFKLATLAEHAGVDLWHYKLPNDRYALAAVLDFMMPYAADEAKKWPYEEIRKYDRTAFSQQLRQGAIVYQDPEYERVVAALPSIGKRRFQLLHPLVRP